MNPDDTWEGEPVETAPFLGTDDTRDDTPAIEQSPAKKIWNKFFNIFVTVTVGVYAGLICRSMQEAWIYAALFCGEALVCACIAGIIKTYYFKKTLTRFSIYFVISAVVTPIACWAGLQFT